MTSTSDDADIDLDFCQDTSLPQPDTCPICYESLSGRGRVRFPCSHAYCFTCVRTYFFSSICQAIPRLVCPDTTCRLELDEPTILIVLDYIPGTTDRYLRLRRINELKGNPNCRWCWRCAEPNLAEDPTSDRLECTSCAAVMCAHCSAEYHPGEPCSDIALESASSSLIRRSSNNPGELVKACPRCRCWIEKTKGCNEIRCANCGCYFCWICLQPSGPGHYDSGPCQGKDGHTAADNLSYYSTLGLVLLASPIWLPMWGMYRLGKKVVSAVTSVNEDLLPHSPVPTPVSVPPRPRSPPSLRSLKSASDSNIAQPDMRAKPIEEKKNEVPPKKRSPRKEKGKDKPARSRARRKRSQIKAASLS